MMKIKPFNGKLQELIDRAELGNSCDVDFILNHLNEFTTFAMTRYVDYALSFVVSTNGIERIEYYLFNGTQIQRNYCSLFFNRRGDWAIVKKAFKQGLIDEIQAFAR
jgi:hypothetical protein